jgi:hypothetical protein
MIPKTELAEMTKGNYPVDGGHLLLTLDEVTELGLRKLCTSQPMLSSCVKH